MDNPWCELAAQPDYVLPMDVAAVSSLNDRTRRQSDAIQLGVLPEPFIGQRDAPIIILNLNPGFREGEDGARNSPALYEAMRKNLLHEAISYPFYYLNPQFERSGGYKWWKPKLRTLVAETSREKLAANLLCAEWFPYASSKGCRIRGELMPSSAYTFQIVREACARDAVVILFRSERLWLAAVPVLASYQRFYKVSNPRQPFIDANNCADGYREALRVLTL